MADTDSINNVDELLAQYQKETGVSYVDDLRESGFEDADLEDAKEIATKDYYDELTTGLDAADIEAPPYLQFYKKFNPTGQYANVENYRNYNKNNKEIEALSDGEVANKVYDIFKNEYGISNMPKFEPWINDWAPKYETNIQLGGQSKVPYTKKDLIKLSGSDVEGAPVGMMRLAESLAFDEEAASKQMKIIAAKTFNVTPEEIDFRENPKSGALEFLNPETGRYQVVNAPNLTFSDIASISGDLMVAIPEVIGGIYGRGLNFLNPVLFKGPKRIKFINRILGDRGITLPIGTGIGSFSAASIGELMRVQLGNMIFKGMNPEITDGEVLKQASQAGYLNALFTQGGLFAANTFKFFRKGLTFGKTKFNDIDFKDFNLNTEEAADVANDMNRKMQEVGITKKVQFNIAEASDDLKLKQALAALENDPSVGLNGKISKMNKERAEAFVEFFKGTGKTKYEDLIKDDDISQRKVGEMIMSALEVGKSGKLKAQKDLLNTSKANLEKTIERLGKTDVKKVDITYDKKKKKSIFTDTEETISFNQQSGAFIRSAIGDVMKETQDKYTKKFAKYGEVYGETPVDLYPLQEALKKFDKRKAETLFANYSNIRSLLDKELLDSSEVSMKYMMNTLSDLKSFQRAVDQGFPGTEGVQLAQVKQLIGAVDKSMKKSLGETSAAYTNYKSLIEDYADDMKNTAGALRKILEVKNGVPVIQNEDVFQQTYKATLPGKETRMDQIYEIMKNRPRVLTNFKQNILKDYKEQVFKNGKFSLDRHNAYIADENYGYALKKVFGSENFGKISKVGGLIKNVENAVKKQDKLVEDLKKATNGLLESNNPATVFKSVYNVDNPELLQDVVKILKKDPQQLNALKRVVMDDVMAKSITPDGYFDASNFKAYFSKRPQSRGKLFDIVFADDKEYLNNVKTLRKALEITQRKAPAKDVTVVENYLNHIIRSRVGVFTPEGRALTAVTAISQNMYKRRLANILGDPEKMKQLAAAEKIKIPKEVAKKGFDAIEAFTRGQPYTQILTDVFGYKSGTYQALGAAPGPTELEVEKELIQNRPLVPDLSSIKSPTQLNNNILAEEVESTPVAQTELPAPAPASSGIGALNPQAQAANYAGLFPEDNLGQAIANQGIRRG